MNWSLRRAAAFALVATLSLAAPLLGRAAAAPFAVVAVAGAAITDGWLFEVFSTARDRRAERLRTLVGFSLAATGVGLLVPFFGVPVGVFVASVLVVGYGDLGRRLVLRYREHRALSMTGFVVAGAAAAFAGQVVVAALTGAAANYPHWVFIAASAALLAGIMRTFFSVRDDPIVLLTVALLLWLFAVLAPLDSVPTAAAWERVLVALAVTVVFGYASHALGATSVAGMLTGVFFGLLAVVLGGYGWFVLLIAFFAVGSLTTKFRYDQKLERGVAEPNEGARGTGNVLGNSAAALFALLLYAAHAHVPLSGAAYQFAYAGSIATALADTLSSEVGGLFDEPRLVTTFERVEPGTDGAVTWQGELAGVAGAAVIGGLCVAVFGFGAEAAAAVVAAGFVGMTADSLAGATVEGGVVGNQAVNFLATLTGGVAGGLLALAVGLA
ncbi:MAG: TIGR00297 family protein [Halobacterium sp.]